VIHHHCNGKIQGLFHDHLLSAVEDSLDPTKEVAGGECLAGPGALAGLFAAV